MLEAGQELWAQGVESGSYPVLRFYQGVLPALVQGPLCRFGDTAANEGVLVLLSTARLPLSLKTALGTLAACSWRAALTPLDTVKLVLEVEGLGSGLELLRQRVAANGLWTFFNGAVGVGVTAAASHLPWFYVNNLLKQRLLPRLPPPKSRTAELWRQAGIGFAATLVSDVVANPLRVLKATVQTSAVALSYAAAAQAIMAQDGPAALMTRGLTAKIAANALQGVAFSVFWKWLMDAWAATPAGGGTRRALHNGVVDLEAAEPWKMR